MYCTWLKLAENVANLGANGWICVFSIFELVESTWVVDCCNVLLKYVPFHSLSNCLCKPFRGLYGKNKNLVRIWGWCIQDQYPKSPKERLQKLRTSGSPCSVLHFTCLDISAPVLDPSDWVLFWNLCTLLSLHLHWPQVLLAVREMAVYTDRHTIITIIVVVQHVNYVFV